MPSSDIKYDRDLQQHDLLCPTNVFYTEPRSDTASLLIPTSMEQQGRCNVPLFMLRCKPPTTSTVVSAYWYHDFSRHMKEDAEYGCLKKNGSFTKQRRNGPPLFPKILYEILSRDDITDIISWCPHVRAWLVHKPKAFEDRVLSEHFRHSKYQSFTRQVTGWGFRRITQDKDKHAYYHEVRRQTARM